MFGSAWENWENALPESAAVTSKQLLCFFIVWFIQAPLVFVHPRKIHWLFTVKGVVLPIATLGLFGWCMANGAGSKSLDLANQAGAAARSTVPLGWAIMNGINTILGTLSPMLVNQPDLARYCKNTRDAVEARPRNSTRSLAQNSAMPWIQPASRVFLQYRARSGWLTSIALFCAKLLVLFLGLASTASMQGVWGEAYWNLWDLLDAILDHHWTGGARTAIWIVSFAYILSCIASNLGANSLPFGSDIASFAPKYINIVRGQVICAVLGVVVQPWQLLLNAAKFLTFLGSYNIYMAPICAVWIVDYLFVRKGNLHTPSMFDGNKGSLYWFKAGVNWVGVLAWTCGMVTGLPGLIGALNPGSVSQTAVNLYKTGWLLSFFTAGTVYFLSCLVAKAKVYPSGYESMPRTWEYMAKEKREGFFDGEREEGMVISSNSSDVETANVTPNKGEKP